MQRFDTIIIGTGCAGFNAADWLYDLGHRNIAILTEGVKDGTSRNTGSDKQTYYKLSLASDGGDSVREMAQTYFAGESMHGDTALIEAACSVKAFMKLVMLGVPFPTNEYGEYVGYKTDHDPRQRATSCGPLTSKLMTEALERSVLSKGIAIHDGKQVIRILTDNNGVTGLAAIDVNDFTYHTYACSNIILATGGPAGVYEHSVYPVSQTGATGLALEAGAKAQNLCEWQYGLASVKFRWNVSGTYQQVLPKYISVGQDGIEREFLPEQFGTPQEALDMVFLKGYQWPFDSRKTGGSSRVDMMVNKEIGIGRRVYMDFRANPSGLENGFDKLDKETYLYLEKSGALFGTPIERLAKMNAPAIALYKDNGIDLYNEPLEVAVCAQHCNGGVAVDANWETSVAGLYAAGEAAGAFGVYRPGGSALNDTQVGSMRAAEHIAGKNTVCRDCNAPALPNIRFGDHSNVGETRDAARGKMSRYAAFLRSPEKMRELLDELTCIKNSFYNEVCIVSQQELPVLYKTYDMLATQVNMLSAMLLAAEAFGSRGSCLVEGAEPFCGAEKAVVTQSGKSCLEILRPLPEGGGWFENVWNEYNRKRGAFQYE